jgi:hypothetical protein
MSDHFWCRADRSEYPPEGVLVWTASGQEVLPGRWSFPGPGLPLVEGKWEDADGQPIAVTHWLFLEESTEPPIPPPQSLPIRGGIKGFRLEG